MDGSENDGVNIVLIAGFLEFAVMICGLIYGAVRSYRSYSARRLKERQK
jgi:hypothetical protein